MNSLRQYKIKTSFGDILTYEKGSGIPVVYLHGWSLTAPACKKILHTLSDTFRIIVPSLPGSYPSFTWKRDHVPLSELGKPLHEWFDRLHVPRGVIVGHSLGGVFATLLAAEKHHHASRLLLVDSVGVPFKRSTKDWRNALIAKRIAQLKRYKFEIAKYADRGFLKNIAFRMRDLSMLSRVAREADIRQIAKIIPIRTDIIWGSDDFFIPSSVGKELVKAFPHAHYSEIDGDHDWPLADPDVLLKILTTT